MKKSPLILLLLVGLFVYGQEKPKKTALLIIDVQEFYFPGGKWELNEPEAAAANVARLLKHFREEGRLVIHVRHNAEPGGSIHASVQPLEGEEIITKEEVNCFKGTPLREILFFNDIRDLVLCGMQTHMCLEAATRAAADLDFKCTVVGDACATRNLTYGTETIHAADVHYSTLATLQSYAKVTDTETYLNSKH